MTDIIDRLGECCASRNQTVEACRRQGDITLDTFLDGQAAHVRKNRTVTPPRSPVDFYGQAARHAAECLGGDGAGEVAEVLSHGVICTADHHGSLFCSQSFQGDLLYAWLLKKLGYQGACVPILSAGQVELENATYARGICAYTSRDEKQLFPLFPAKCSVQLASCAAPVDDAMLDRFRKHCIAPLPDPALKSTLEEILEEVFGHPSVRKAERFADQVTAAGAILSRRLFSGGDAPVFLYLEIEECAKPLLLKELREKDSLVTRLLTDPGLRRGLAEAKARDGTSLAGCLFRGHDSKGRKIALTLTADGSLAGHDWHREEVRYPADPASLIPLLESRDLIPGIFTIALLLFFERGITWMGGMFQSVYLPGWQAIFAQLLEEAGMQDMADTIRAYDCTGYISGPMFSLFAGDGYANAAGPVELWMARPSCSGLEEQMKQTTLWDSHLIGLPEMYFDLVPRDGREEDWYHRIAEAMYRRFPDNRLRLRHA